MTNVLLSLLGFRQISHPCDVYIIQDEMIQDDILIILSIILIYIYFTYLVSKSVLAQQLEYDK